MASNLLPPKMFQFITGDFEDAWNSLASNPKAGGRGNFLFALDGMIFLEWAARLCKSDPTSLRALDAALFLEEKRYFTPVPGLAPDWEDFKLPDNGVGPPNSPLLHVIFDVIRNGQAHQYQQIIVDMADPPKHFYVTLWGADSGRSLDVVSKRRDADHLAYAWDGDGDLKLVFRPDIFYLDLKKAITSSGILNKGLFFPYLTRPRAPRPGKAPTGKVKPRSYFEHTTVDLERALGAGGHPKI